MKFLQCSVNGRRTACWCCFLDLAFDHSVCFFNDLMSGKCRTPYSWRLEFLNLFSVTVNEVLSLSRAAVGRVALSWCKYVTYDAKKGLQLAPAVSRSCTIGLAAFQSFQSRKHLWFRACLVCRMPASEERITSAIVKIECCDAELPPMLTSISCSFGSKSNVPTRPKYARVFGRR
jgi:hypothetical protein